MAAKIFYLTFRSGPEAGRRVEITGPSFLIGRDPSADLMVDDIEVSRRHARFIAQSGGYVIEDLGSTNGTFVNGARLTSVLPLSNGASINLGENIMLAYSTEITPEADTDPVPFRKEQLPPEITPPVEPLPPAETPSLDYGGQWEPELEAYPDFADPEPEPEPIAPMRTGQLPPEPGRPARNRGLNVSNPWVVGCGILLLLGLCGLTAFLWYVDANFLWCDVFGGLIPACR